MRNKIAGIYSLTNKTTNKKYIGQTVYLNGRKGDHLLNLRRNQHDNDYLQKAFNKYGEDEFIFEVLEVIEKLESGANDKDRLTEREQYWMDYYNCYDRECGYNINPSAEVNYMSGKTHTEEARKKISEAAKGRKMTEEDKERLITSRTNKPSKAIRKIPIKEAKHEIKKVGKTLYEYHVKTPEGIEHTFTNLAEFCNLNNLSRTHLANMINKGKFYKGWRGHKIDIKEAKENVEIIISEQALISNSSTGIYEYHLFDRDNKEYIFRNMNVFCEKNKISKSTILQLMDNKIDYRGWKIHRIQIK